MNLNQNSSNRKTFKAFTLIELIIVIAIIAILASMLSLFMPGFIRDANLETYNKNAQMAYTGMQNCIVNWELTQDNTCVNTDALSTTNSYPTDPVTYSTISFQIIAGNVGNQIKVTSIYNNDVSKTVMVKLAPDITMLSSTDPAVTVDAEKAYEKLAKMIKDNFGSMIEGNFTICIDYEDYTVDSVVYLPISEGSNTVTVNEMNWADDDSTVAPAKAFLGCANYDTQVLFYKTNKMNCGGYYPMAESIASVKVISKDAELPLDDEEETPPVSP